MFKPQNPNPIDEHLRWRYITVDPKQPLDLFMAGTVVGVNTHWHGRSVPCRKQMSDGALKCICDVQPIRDRWVGYVPLYEVTGRKLVVAINRDHFQAVQGIDHLAKVKVSKGKKPKDPVLIRPYGDTQLSPFRGRKDLKPADLTEWLLVIWQDAELTVWLKEHRVPAPAEPAPPAPKPQLEWVRGVHDDMIKDKIRNDPEAREEIRKMLRERFTMPELTKNGKPDQK